MVPLVPIATGAAISNGLVPMSYMALVFIVHEFDVRKLNEACS